MGGVVLTSHCSLFCYFYVVTKKKKIRQHASELSQLCSPPPLQLSLSFVFGVPVLLSADSVPHSVHDFVRKGSPGGWGWVGGVEPS
jgi:hypothetical protein